MHPLLWFRIFMHPNVHEYAHIMVFEFVDGQKEPLYCGDYLHNRQYELTSGTTYTVEAELSTLFGPITGIYTLLIEEYVSPE